MTQAEALAEAKRRWGPDASVVKEAVGQPGSHRFSRFLVRGPDEGAGNQYGTSYRGWIPAFADADRRSRKGNPFLEKALGADRVRDLIAHFGDMRRVLEAPEEDLRAARVPAKAIRAILDAREIRGDYLDAEIPAGEPLRTPESLARWFRRRLEGLDQEQFWVVGLNAKLRPIRDYMVSQGLVDASLVGPKETFSGLLKMKATAFACAHNHPSGDPTPSVEDVELTRRLASVAEIAGLRFLDHIVIGAGVTYTSFNERGLMPPRR